MADQIHVLDKSIESNVSVSVISYLITNIIIETIYRRIIYVNVYICLYFQSYNSFPRMSIFVHIFICIGTVFRLPLEGIG